jgi:hypothetical protein
MKRVISGIFLFLTVLIDIWLFFKSQEPSSFYLILFGLYNAIPIPIACSFLINSFDRNDREIIRQLSKVPEINKMASEAKNTEIKIENLKHEYENLETLIQSESKRIALISQKENLENEAKRILKELDIIEEEIKILSERKIQGFSIDEVTKLRTRIEAKKQGNIIIEIGNLRYVLEKENVLLIPFFGDFIFLYVKLFVLLREIINKIFFGENKQ